MDPARLRRSLGGAHDLVLLGQRRPVDAVGIHPDGRTDRPDHRRRDEPVGQDRHRDRGHLADRPDRRHQPGDGQMGAQSGGGHQGRHHAADRRCGDLRPDHPGTGQRPVLAEPDPAMGRRSRLPSGHCLQFHGLRTGLGGRRRDAQPRPRRADRGHHGRPADLGLLPAGDLRHSRGPARQGHRPDRRPARHPEVADGRRSGAGRDHPPHRRRGGVHHPGQSGHLVHGRQPHRPGRSGRRRTAGGVRAAA
ncbi:hypothetical protein BREV_BREV_03514 [Brevundimonas mediterranea]|uniref:Uncharacterized protein n=1 Tax=Brevundimonas mediterranea TaxID=74329 RepID=A0A7Z9C4P3_9CAUL|nr:hypothetical protein BREV_BREV_03514 [Brevundimonas mediterranea]